MSKLGVVKAKLVYVYSEDTLEVDCFFDMFTQSVNVVDNVKDYVDKYLRLEDGTIVREFI